MVDVWLARADALRHAPRSRKPVNFVEFFPLPWDALLEANESEQEFSLSMMK
jgi:hypothetical protein